MSKDKLPPRSQIQNRKVPNPMSEQILEEPNEEDDLEGLPTIYETVEWALGVAMDLENALPDDEDPFELSININVNAGQLLNLCWFFAELYAAVEDVSEEDMEQIEHMVKAKKLAPPSKEYIH